MTTALPIAIFALSITLFFGVIGGLGIKIFMDEILITTEESSGIPLSKSEFKPEFVIELSESSSEENVTDLITKGTQTEYKPDSKHETSSESSLSPMSSYSNKSSNSDTEDTKDTNETNDTKDTDDNKDIHNFKFDESPYVMV